MVILFILLFLVLTAPAQIPFNVKPYKIDSLLLRLEATADTERVNVLNNLALYLADRNVDSACRYAREALDESRRLDFTRGEGIALMNQGHCYFVRTDLKTALDNYFAALRILEPLGPDRNLESLYLYMGFITSLVPGNDAAVKYFLSARKTARALGPRQPWEWGGEIRACFELADYYWRRQIPLSFEESKPLLDSASRYIDRVMELIPYDTTRNLDVLIDALNMKGSILSESGKDEAHDYLVEALHLSLKMLKTKAFSPLWLEYNLDSTLVECYVGMLYLNLGGYWPGGQWDPERSKEYYMKSLDVLKKGDYIEMKALASAGLGWAFWGLHEYEKAISYIEQSLDYCNAFINYPDKRKHMIPDARIKQLCTMKSYKVVFLDGLAYVYETTGDYRTALEYQKMAQEASKELMMDDFDQQMNILQTDYENEMTTQQLVSLENRNEISQIKLSRTRFLFFGTVSFTLAVIVLLLFYFQRNRFRTEQRELVLKQKLLRAQMNPHFIFNSLYSIQNFIMTEKPDKASIYLSKFARLVRNILDNSTEEFVPLEKEISTIENYLELQQIRFTGKFEYRIDIADDIDPEILKIPPMLAQPFIENAIEHGVRHRETPGHIGIRLRLRDHTLIFEVEDDGVGRQKAREIEVVMNPEHRSMATSLTRERLANLSRKLKMKIALEIIDLQDALGQASGTMVRFTIPIS